MSTPSPTRANAPLRQMLNDHQVTCVEDGERLRVEGSGHRMQAWLSTIQTQPDAVSVQLDVELELWQGQVLIESCGGFGATEAEAHQHAFANFAASTLPVLLRAFLRPAGKTEVTVSEWESAGIRREVLTGPLVYRGQQPSEDTTRTWLQTLEAVLKTQPVAPGTHWVRVFYAHQPGQPDTLEVLLDNAPWEAMQRALTHAPWPRLPEFFSQRLFLVIRGGLDVSRALPLLLEQPARGADQVIQELRNQGATPLEAAKVYSYLPMAFAQEIFEERGVRFPHLIKFSFTQLPYLRHVTLNTDPLWRESQSLARRAARDSWLSPEDSLRVALLFPLAASLFDSLNNGRKLEGTRILPLMVMPALDAAVELGLTTSNPKADRSAVFRSLRLLVKTGSLFRPKRRTDLGSCLGEFDVPLGLRLFVLFFSVPCLYLGSGFLMKYWEAHSARLHPSPSSLLPGLALSLLGLVIFGTFWWLSMMGSAVFEEGAVRYFMGHDVVLRFRDLKTFSCLLPGDRGVERGEMTFIGKDGTSVTLPSIPRERAPGLTALRDRLAEQLAEGMAARLEYGVDWLEEFELRREGLAAALQEGAGVLRYSDFTYSDDGGFFTLKQGGQEIGQCWTSLLNFYPGLVLFKRLWASARR